MIFAEGIGRLVRLYRRVNAAVDKELMTQHVLLVLRNAANQQAIFMQDNAPRHKAKTGMSFFKEENVIVMDWTAQRLRHEPYRKCLEDSWRTLQNKKSLNNKQLWTTLKEKWNKISLQDIK